MKSSIPIFLLFPALLFCGGLLRAQDTPSLKAAVDRDHVLLGEPVRLGVDVVFPAGMPVPLPKIDSIAHFEFLAKPKIDSLTEGVNIHYRMEWKLSSFDSGVFKIPALSVHIGNKDYRSDSIAIAVGYGNADSVKEYHDIKTIIDQANPAVRYIPWVLGVLTLLAALATWFFAAREGFVASREKRKGALPQRGAKSAYEEALAALDELRRMNPADPAAVKKYYAGMNDVLRVYLNRSQGLASMEKTNEEMILHLSRFDLERSAFTRYASLLRIVDFVKFAKYLPGAADNEKNLDTMREAIRIINEIRR